MAVQFQQKTAVKKTSQGLGDSGEEWKITHHGFRGKHPHENEQWSSSLKESSSKFPYVIIKINSRNYQLQ